MSDRFIRRHECRRTTGLSDTTIWRLEKMGEFPGRRRLSRSAIGWLESEVCAWLESRPAAAQRTALTIERMRDTEEATAEDVGLLDQKGSNSGGASGRKPVRRQEEKNANEARILLPGGANR